jgi:hypothetical protein
MLAASALLPDVPFVLVTPSADLPEQSLPENVTVYRDTTSERFWELLGNARLVVTPLKETGAAGLSVLLMTAIVGRLSIATSTPATQSLFPRKCHDLLVPIGDHGALARAVEKHWESPDTRCRVASEVQEFVLSQRSPALYCSLLAGIIDALATPTERPDNGGRPR